MTDDRTKQWYIVHTYSGFENKVKESLEQRVTAYGLQDEIGEILIPTEQVAEMRGGKKVVSSKRPSAPIWPQASVPRSPAGFPEAASCGAGRAPSSPPLATAAEPACR